jgi:hypothetical protein
MRKFNKADRLFVFKVLICLKVWLGVVVGTWFTESPIVHGLVVPLFLVTLWISLRGSTKTNYLTPILALPYGISLALVGMINRPAIQTAHLVAVFIGGSFLLLLVFFAGLRVASSASTKAA